MKKRKLLTGLLIATAFLGLASCGGNSKKDDSSSNNNQSQTDETKYTVKFNTNGGSDVSSIEVVKDGKAAAPNAPTKDADADNTYSFAGWYKDAGFTQAFDFTTETITGNITLYAKWDATPITKYEVDGNSSPLYVAVKKGTRWVDIECPFTKEGYRFIGWINQFSSEIIDDPELIDLVEFENLYEGTITKSIVFAPGWVLDTE